MIFVIGRVAVDEPFIYDEAVTLTSAINDCSMPFSENEQKRGILRVGAKIEAKESKAVFEIQYRDTKIEHIDFEYPDAIEGDVLDIIYDKNSLQIFDVVFRPWKTELKGENVLGGEGRPLPYKLIVKEKSTGDITRLVVHGRNSNDNGENHRNNNQMENFKRLSEMEEIKHNSGIVEEVIEDGNPLCSWDSGLIFINQGYYSYINDSSFIDISEGAIFVESSSLNMNNCSFENNHPINEGWMKFPSLHHNFRVKGRSTDKYISINSLKKGSDGTEGKPLGMISSANVGGSAVDNASSLFFIPVLLNVSLEKGDQRNVNGMVYQTNDESVIAVVSGEYLFPCGLTFEASKKRKDQELKWIDCPVSEYVNETRMNVKIPKSVLDVDDYTSVVCRLSYPNGMMDEKKSKSKEFVFVKQKKEETANDEPKDKKSSQIIIIAVSVSVFVVVVAVVTAIVAIYIMKKKKPNRYKSIYSVSKQ
ncbi:uncharacterized protein MONOS_13780 [Monocercomonoides exilis]|uniref:uncharacterized protein n=1 Tax=Monocercomonoides exilis TaxID=2049356 RepID=UPI0035594C52|nr:hypothetical protein MONOS_13780 [Monocercomonoides exilis]|eukprot:MONOS_13780.1-p1 / transcript=MONOS_13780.1 / gene=MONOS_13780 / organism=Monocercomonoides_exilis_PA203 / gene_product=unspecified product / transcript_product=unspecified product / location=Mono_scaffold00882:7964-9391(+) / protein_length=476 / sequence_SO=supercontig / SO=protein_coding / is_pseudo=false